MFPFDMEKLSSEMIDDMQEWSYGLLEALKMRPEIWHIGYDKDYEDAAEDIKDVIISFCILCGMVYPEEGQGLFEEKNGKPIKDIFILGEAGFLPDFEDQLVGMKAGELAHPLGDLHEAAGPKGMVEQRLDLVVVGWRLLGEAKRRTLGRLDGHRRLCVG